jgi:malonyl-ACP O-methyltransferase BioC
VNSANSYRTRQFDRAARRYDHLSSVQRQMAERLMELVPEGTAPRSMLELGSGTGHLTRLLLARWPECRAIVSDVSEAMLAICRQALAADHPACEWQRLDAARLDDAWHRVRETSPCDLVASNALVQWLPDLGAHLRAVRELLSQSGQYLLSGFSADHFPELRAIVEHPPFDLPSLPGIDLADVAVAAETTGLRLGASTSEALPVTYPTVMALLHSLREMGASRYPSAPRLTPSRLRLLEQTYTTRHSVADGVVCTWKPWYALLVAV